MTPHSAAEVLLGVIAIFWLQAILTLGLWKQIHHFYFGAALVIFTDSFWLWLLGLFIALDDAVQHTIQETQPSYLSPLHKCYNWVYRLFPKWLQHLCDKI
jgi:hypothetical protein